MGVATQSRQELISEARAALHTHPTGWDSVR